MANGPPPTDPMGPTFFDEIDLLFGAANPNPNRIGCPAASVLVSLSRAAPSMDDPIYEHLATCSPCYQEVRGLRANASGSGRAGVPSPRWLPSRAR
jgi:hypothetical protein